MIINQLMISPRWTWKVVNKTIMPEDLLKFLKMIVWHRVAMLKPISWITQMKWVYYKTRLSSLSGYSIAPTACSSLSVLFFKYFLFCTGGKLVSIKTSLSALLNRAVNNPVFMLSNFRNKRILLRNCKL